MWIQAPICIGNQKLPSLSLVSGFRNRMRGRVGARESKMVINNQNLYSTPGVLFPSIVDRSANGIYLSNERADVDKALENRRRKVSYCGSPGAYTELAALELCPGCEYVSRESWGAAVADLIAGDVERAVIPVESFYTKRIRILYDVMVRHDLHIIDEVFLNISHSLLAVHGTSLSDVTQIVSHPQALLQCQKYIEANKNQIEKIMELPDTAEAARQLAVLHTKDTAVIASRRCIYLYNLKCLANNIQDNENNPTRFVTLAKQQVLPVDVDPSQCKTSIFFGLPNDDKAGALSKALSYFAENKVNLIWLDSQKLYPEERQQWREDLHFLFYANFEGLVSEERVQRALTGLRNVAPFMRVMGSHKMHRKFLEDFP